MKHLAVLLAAFFAFSGLPVLASAASSSALRAPSVAGSTCRPKKKAKKVAVESKGKKKKKAEKAYGFEL